MFVYNMRCLVIFGVKEIQAQQVCKIVTGAGSKGAILLSNSYNIYYYNKQSSILTAYMSPFC